MGKRSILAADTDDSACTSRAGRARNSALRELLGSSGVRCLPLLLGASVFVACGGRTSALADDFEAIEMGGEQAKDGGAPATGGMGQGGHGGTSFVSGGTTHSGGYPSGGTGLLTGKGGNRFAQGGATGGNRFAQGGATGGNRFTQGGATGGNRFAQGGAPGGNRFTLGGYSGGGRGGTGGTTECPSWAGCILFVGGRGGSGGMGGSAAAGGTGGSSTGGKSTTVPSCVPGTSTACACTDGSSGAQVCQPDGTYAACKCLLTDMRSRIVGAWVGTRTTSWDGQHSVKVQFRNDGTYSGYCADACITMYWGTDADSSEKTYSIDSVNSDGIGFGRIAVYFGPNNTNQGALRDIQLDASGNVLSFAVWKDSYGPLSFALTR